MQCIYWWWMVYRADFWDAKGWGPKQRVSNSKIRPGKPTSPTAQDGLADMIFPFYPNPRHQSSYSQMMTGMSLLPSERHSLFGFHYHSQKVIRSLEEGGTCYRWFPAVFNSIFDDTHWTLTDTDPLSGQAPKCLKESRFGRIFPMKPSLGTILTGKSFEFCFGKKPLRSTVACLHKYGWTWRACWPMVLL